MFSDRLPSVKELAERLGINPNTVAKSYRDLDVLGYVYTRRGKGIYIREGIAAKCREACRKKIIERLHEVVSEARSAGMTAAEVKLVVSKSFSADIEPYGDTPKDILALARK